MNCRALSPACRGRFRHGLDGFLVLALVLVSVAGCTAIQIDPDFMSQPGGQMEMTLISNQENTHFEIKEIGKDAWTQAGKGKIVDARVDSDGRYEIRATPDGYRPKTVALATPVRELRFTFEISDKLGGGTHVPVAVAAHRARPSARRSTPSGPGTSYAVCIGVSKFVDPKLSRLPYASKDARDVANLLLAQPGMGPDTVKLLIDAEATKANIEDALEGFLSKAGPNDMVLLYWSGHGYPEPANPKKVYFACYDTRLDRPHSGYRMDKVRSSLEEKRARHTVVFADTCHAGKIITRGVGGVSHYVQDLGTNQNVPEGMALLVAAAADRQAVEGSAWSNGAFTHILLEALRGKADGYLGAGAQDNRVTLGELRAYMQSRMPAETLKVLGKGLHASIAVTTGDEAINDLQLSVVE